jgi:hypothetical protein
MLQYGKLYYFKSVETSSSSAALVFVTLLDHSTNSICPKSFLLPLHCTAHENIQKSTHPPFCSQYQHWQCSGSMDQVLSKYQRNHLLPNRTRMLCGIFQECRRLFMEDGTRIAAGFCCCQCVLAVAPFRDRSKDLVSCC